MLEIIVSVIAKGNKAKRSKAAWIIGICIFIFGIPSALSFGVLSDLTLFNKSFFDLADYTVSNIIMPLGSLMMALFVSFKMKKSALFEEMNRGSNIKQAIFQIWFILIRYIAPVLIMAVMLDVLGVW